MKKDYKKHKKKLQNKLIKQYKIEERKQLKDFVEIKNGIYKATYNDSLGYNIIVYNAEKNKIYDNNKYVSGKFDKNKRMQSKQVNYLVEMFDSVECELTEEIKNDLNKDYSLKNVKRTRGENKKYPYTNKAIDSMWGDLLFFFKYSRVVKPSFIALSVVVIASIAFLGFLFR